MKISELPEKQLTDSIEQILSAITEFLDLELEYDYEIVAYETPEKDGKEKEERELLRISLKGQQDALLIGYHGRTLEQLQQLVSLGLAQEFKQIVRVVLDINEYRGKRQAGVESLARRAAQQVLESGQEMELDPMSPSDRRIVHQILSEEGKVTTESIGEGNDRRIVVKPL